MKNIIIKEEKALIITKMFEFYLILKFQKIFLPLTNINTPIQVKRKNEEERQTDNGMKMVKKQKWEKVKK